MFESHGYTSENHQIYCKQSGIQSIATIKGLSSGLELSFKISFNKFHSCLFYQFFFVIFHFSVNYQYNNITGFMHLIHQLFSFPSSFQLRCNFCKFSKHLFSAFLLFFDTILGTIMFSIKYEEFCEKKDIREA